MRDITKPAITNGANTNSIDITKEYASANAVDSAVMFSLMKSMSESSVNTCKASCSENIRALSTLVVSSGSNLKYPGNMPMTVAKKIPIANILKGVRILLVFFPTFFFNTARTMNNAIITNIKIKQVFHIISIFPF